MSTLRLKDQDTGESCLDVVAVPEGFSLQMYFAPETGLDIPGGYISVIIDWDRASDLADFLRGLP